MIFRKQQIKERDGFCRRVDKYDGSVVIVDQKPTYEIGNYLGGGVAGVVYEGHRLRPIEEYPVRTGIDDEKKVESPISVEVESEGFFCAPVNCVETSGNTACGDVNNVELDEETLGSPSIIQESKNPVSQVMNHEEVDVAIEATVSQNEHGVMLDAQDAPSRSKHYTQAASVKLNSKKQSQQQKSLEHGLTEETVAVKILNPVGYRIHSADALKGTVVAREGKPMDADVKKGLKPMQEEHVWWLVNPNSRNLRTLQRYGGNNDAGRGGGIEVDRGSANKGLRLSLIAAYIDPRSEMLIELTLTRCIEIWGHIPFNATDVEFEEMMTAIERVNAGQPPPPLPAFVANDDNPPSRVGTDSSTSHSGNETELSPVTFKTART